jgi:hypothetical protein
MFMDYQKAEQEKHYNDGTNKFQYDPTGLFDPLGAATIPLNTPMSIPLPGTTAEATEQDVNNESTQWRKLHQDLENYKADIRTKKKSIDDSEVLGYYVDSCFKYELIGDSLNILGTEPCQFYYIYFKNDTVKKLEFRHL